MKEAATVLVTALMTLWGWMDYPNIVLSAYKSKLWTR